MLFPGQHIDTIKNTVCVSQSGHLENIQPAWNHATSFGKSPKWFSTNPTGSRKTDSENSWEDPRNCWVTSRWKTGVNSLCRLNWGEQGALMATNLLLLRARQNRRSDLCPGDNEGGEGGIGETGAGWGWFYLWMFCYNLSSGAWYLLQGSGSALHSTSL